MTPEVNVVLIDFKSTMTKELVTPNEDGSYTILLNSRMASNQLEEAYQHAMRHIENNDFEKHDVQQIEAVAHQIMTAANKPAAMSSKKFEQYMKRSQRRIDRLRSKLLEEERMRALYSIQMNSFQAAEYRYLYGNDL